LNGAGSSAADVPLTGWIARLRIFTNDRIGGLYGAPEGLGMYRRRPDDRENDRQKTKGANP
jgi:hypothetical protein